jgi:biopolymer transport protein ExbD
MKHLFNEEIDDASLINLTPLIDVLFTVLVLFIVISPFLDIESIQLGSKSKQSVGQTGKRKIRIFVDRHQKIKINDTPVSEKQLKAVLEQLRKNFSDEIPELYQDKKSSFESYLNIQNALEHAGFVEMDLVVQSEG